MHKFIQSRYTCNNWKFQLVFWEVSENYLLVFILLLNLGKSTVSENFSVIIQNFLQITASQDWHPNCDVIWANPSHGKIDNFCALYINPNPLGILARNLPASSKTHQCTFGKMPSSSKCTMHFRWFFIYSNYGLYFLPGTVMLPHLKKWKYQFLEVQIFSQKSGPLEDFDGFGVVRVNVSKLMRMLCSLKNCFIHDSTISITWVMLSGSKKNQLTSLCEKPSSHNNK